MAQRAGRFWREAAVRQATEFRYNCCPPIRAVSRAPPAAMSDLAEESPGLALGTIAVESSLPAALLHQGKHRVDRWCCDLDEAAHFLDGGNECIDL
jgi:hypothetical protein